MDNTHIRPIDEIADALAAYFHSQMIHPVESETGAAYCKYEEAHERQSQEMAEAVLLLVEDNTLEGLQLLMEANQRVTLDAALKRDKLRKQPLPADAPF